MQVKYDKQMVDLVFILNRLYLITVGRSFVSCTCIIMYCVYNILIIIIIIISHEEIKLMSLIFEYVQSNLDRPGLG